jgi:dTDP-4-dehydrorhamnose reductase
MMFLLIGGDSEIGGATFQELIRRGEPVLATTRRPERVSAQRPFLDLRQPLKDWDPPAGTQSACVFASVARMAVCASDPAGSRFINVEQSLAITDRMTAQGIYALLLSTNQVFDGSEPHIRADTAPKPISEYGRQKAELESGLRARMQDGAQVAILRLTKVVSPGMPLFQEWLSQLAAGKPIQAFSDMTLAPTPMAKVTETIAVLLRDRATGVFQLSGPRDVTYAEAGRWLAARIGADHGLVKTARAASAGFTEGTIPAHTTLDSNLLRQRYGLSIPDAWDVMETVVAAASERQGPR